MDRCIFKIVQQLPSGFSTHNLTCEHLPIHMGMQLLYYYGEKKNSRCPNENPNGILSVEVTSTQQILLGGWTEPNYNMESSIY